MHHSLRLGASLLALVATAATLPATTGPTAMLKNGTYVGKYVASFDQDLFLGIRYAQPPVGSLRLQNPQSLNTTFGTAQATEYASSCVGYGNSPAWPFTLGEDCLTLNVVRPARYNASSGLPVGVFLHGGGWSMDYSANGVYNLSFMVEQSVAMKKPIVAVSLDYRLSGWGFLASQDILDAGVANLGLKDQYLALQFIQENIAAFGGDPAKVVIFGESAGGGNVGYMATAYGGRDDGLFRGMISQSGAEGNRLKNLTAGTAKYNNITTTVGCGNRTDKLACLREVSFDELNQAINQSSGGYSPIVDGDLIPEYSSVLLAQGKFIKKPFLLGTNADEGTLFTSAAVNNTDRTIAASIAARGPDANATAIIMELYPNIDALGLPTAYRPSLDAPSGTQFKRAIALATDQGFLSWRRQRTDAWSKARVPVYSYLFDSPWLALPASSGTSHFTEIPYVFYNLEFQGFAANARPVFDNTSQPLMNLAKLVCRMWLSFIHDLDPNNHGIPDVPKWPIYNATGGYGQNFLLHPSNFGPEPDTFRLAGTTFINSVSESQYGK